MAGLPVQRREFFGTTLEGLKNELSLYLLDIIDAIERPDEIVTVTADHTVGLPESTILVDPAGGAITISLPDAAQAAGRIYRVVRIVTVTTAITVDPLTGDVNGGATFTLGTALFDHAAFVSDGVDYFTVSRHP